MHTIRKVSKSLTFTDTIENIGLLQIKNKSKQYIIVFLGILFINGLEGFGQVYNNENELTLIVKGQNDSFSFFSNYVSTTMNEPQSELVLTGQFKTFGTDRDTTNPIVLSNIFDPNTYPAFNLRFNPVSFNNMDRATDNKQVITLNGTLSIGNTSTPISTSIELDFMDKQLLFKLYFSVKLQTLGIPIPEIYKDKINGNLEFRIDNGRMLIKNR
jgi:hypothetical protein